MSLVPAHTTASLPLPRIAAVAPDAHGARKRKILRVRESLLQARGDRLIGARDQQIRRFFEQTRGDGGDLLRRLALAEDHFREAVPQRAMMIQLGAAQILEWQVTHPIDRGIDLDGARAHLFEQAAQLILIHST